MSQLRLFFIILAVCGASGAMTSDGMAHACKGGHSSKLNHFYFFYSHFYSGRVAILPEAANVDDARTGQVYCVLSSRSVTVQLTDDAYLWFAINNMTRDENLAGSNTYAAIEVTGFGKRSNYPVHVKKYASSLWLPEEPVRQMLRMMGIDEALAVVADEAGVSRRNMSELDMETHLDTDWFGTLPHSVDDNRQISSWRMREGFRSFWDFSKKIEDRSLALLKVEFLPFVLRYKQPILIKEDERRSRVVFGYNTWGLDSLTLRIFSPSEVLGEQEFTIKFER